MGTQQALTTKQMELLILVRAIEEFGNEQGNDTAIMEILTQDHYMSVEEYTELNDALEQYGYVDEEGYITTDGKQYIALFEEELKKKAEKPNVEIEKNFIAINIEQLNIGINKFNEKSGGNPILDVLIVILKKVILSKLG